MKLTCSICNERPKASVKSRRCLPCERQYNRYNNEARRAAKKRWREKNKAKIAKQREDKIQFWMSRAADEITNLREEYTRRGRMLPREFYVAMNRLDKRRTTSALEHLATLPTKLSKAALRMRKANLSGSRPRDHDKAIYGI